MKRYNLYQEPNHREVDTKLLPVKTYMAAMSSLTIVCTDVYLVQKDPARIYLAERAVEPAFQKLWAIGGRKYAMETPTASAVRHLKNDLGLTIAEGMLQLVNLQEYFWAKTKQGPGSDNLCFTFALAVQANEIEISRQNIREGEYNLEVGLVEYSYRDLLKNLDQLVCLDDGYPTIDFFESYFNLNLD